MNWIKRDQNVIWHPYTPLLSEDMPIAIQRGEGSYLIDFDNKRYIDAISSWWVNLHGHSHPYIAQKVYEQLLQLEHVIFARFTHQPAIELAERLLSLFDGAFQKVFYSDNGSTAVEVALKMCVQFWDNRHRPKNKIIAFENAYHGDTFGAMSVGARSAFTKAYTPLLFDVYHTPVPFLDQTVAIEQFENYVKQHADDVACFIFEPLIQGAGGMLMYPPENLDTLLSICKQYDVLTIADEVMTGFGRTGKLFACDYLQHKPDIICLSKGISGGVLPLAATLCNETIIEAFHTAEREKMLFHGHSFTANPTACAAALASLDLLLKNDTLSNIHRIAMQHQHFKERIAAHPRLKNVRQTGTIIAMDWQNEEQDSYFNSIGQRLSTFFLKHGILLRPLGNVLYILPPYCTNEQELQYIYEKIEDALSLF